MVAAARRLLRSAGGSAGRAPGGVAAPCGGMRLIRLGRRPADDADAQPPAAARPPLAAALGGGARGQAEEQAAAWEEELRDDGGACHGARKRKREPVADGTEGAAAAGSAGAERFAGAVRSFHSGVGLGFIACAATQRLLGRDVVVDRAEVTGFEVGDPVTFALMLDVEMGTPKAVQLEADHQSSCGGRRYSGIVKCFNQKQGVGQIASEELGHDVPVLGAQLAGFSPGDAVSFRLAARQGAGARVALALEADRPGVHGPQMYAGEAAAERAVRRAIAQRDLELAAEGKDKAALHEALAEARGAGVQRAALSQGDRALRKLGVAQRLQRFVKDEHLAPLREACAVALDAGFESRLLQDAAAILSRRAAAVEELQATAGGSDEVSLRMALAHAREAGVQAGTMREAEATLRRLVAARSLVVAVSGMDEVALRMSLARARECKIQSRTVEEAEHALQRIAAINELSVAVCGTDEAALRRAVAQARAVGVQRGTVCEGEAAVQRLTAARELAAAVDSGGVAALRSAICEAKVRGVQAGEVRLAEAVAGRLSAKVELETAAAGPDEVALRVALAVAAEAGVAGSALARAEGALRRLVATKELEAAVASGDKVFLQKALLQAAAAGVDDILALDAALLAASDQGLPAALLQQAEEHFAHCVTSDALREALEAGDERALRAALASAHGCGLHGPVVEEAEGRLRRLAGLRGLARALELAQSLELTGTLCAEDEGVLLAAVEEAAKAGVEDAELVEVRVREREEKMAGRRARTLPR